NMLAPESEHPLALDGLAIIVNKANPLNKVAFTSETIAQIFAGEISDWSKLGGSAGSIQLYARDEKSGTRGTFDDLVMKPLKRNPAASAKTFEISDELTEAVAKDPGGIGFIGLPYIGDNQALAIGSNCGISHLPSRFSVQSEVYALTRRLYLYTAGAPHDPISSNVIDFATSDATQPIGREQRFIDQTIEFEDAQLKAKRLEDVGVTTDPRAPGKVVEGMLTEARLTTRASVTFRFASSSSNLDNKALGDVKRLARLLKSPQM